MTSFLSKIFGPKNKHTALLYFTDDRAEAAEISLDSKSPCVLALNKTDIPKGVVEDGDVKMRSQLRNILNNLFLGARPRAISAKKIYVSIPFKQIYSFVRVFPRGADKDRVKADMDEAVLSEIPFSKEEVDIIFNTRQQEGDLVASAVVIPNDWEFSIKRSLQELGFETIEFIPEPLAHISLYEARETENIVLFSFQDSKIFLSVFYAGVLYDSYLCKQTSNTNDLFAEFRSAKQNFKNNFNKNIHSICFAGAPDDFAREIEEDFAKYDEKVVFIAPRNKFFTELQDGGYSLSLSGMAKKSLNYE